MANDCRRHAPIENGRSGEGRLRDPDIRPGQTRRDETRPDAAFQAISHLCARAVVVLVVGVIDARLMSGMTTVIQCRTGGER